MVRPVPGPDRLEKGIRFGCGALFGFFVVVPFAARFWFRWDMAWLTIALCLIGMLAFAFLAMSRGDRFWMGLWNWYWPWDRWRP